MAQADILFQTSRLTCRNFEKSDWRMLQRIGGHPDVAPMTGTITSPWPKSDVMKRMQTPFIGEIPFEVGLYDADGLIGFVGISLRDEVGYAIAPWKSGQGYATEMMGPVLDLAFERLKMPFLNASVFEDNPASTAVLHKAGFEKISNGMGKARARLEPAPIINYRLTQHNYESLKP
ncbi:MAG: GNAT family N-acetyltransferase [Halocynthiibacter sp.]